MIEILFLIDTCGREGNGSKELGISLMRQLYLNKPEWLLEIVFSIPIIGCFKDFLKYH